jgi:hypothetical protein
MPEAVAPAGGLLCGQAVLRERLWEGFVDGIGSAIRREILGRADVARIEGIMMTIRRPRRSACCHQTMAGETSGFISNRVDQCP